MQKSIVSTSLVLLRSLALSLLLGIGARATEVAANPPAQGPCEVDLLKSLTTANFRSELLDAPDIRGQVTRLLSGMDERRKIVLNQRLGVAHARREMSFQVKNEQTGNYDKFVAVDVNAQVVPLLESDFNRLVASTGPLMREYRRLLQKIYSREAPSASELGLDGLPKAERDLAMHTIFSSIYFEPALVHPNMEEYPFLSVAGFDGAVVDPKNPTCDFFETNLGTPSGISNNSQLLENLLSSESQLRSQVVRHLPDDPTFEFLRQAVESNAWEWTRTEGISVVISPGVYNGAHPDVAAIARATGMPLVRSSDFYEDENGYVRLNTGASHRDPVVTGIYGRMEESFFLQSEQDRVPMVSPTAHDHEALSKRLGVELRKGALYDFKYDASGAVVGVHTDEKGRPRYLPIWDSIGRDPARPNGPRGSFLRAIQRRKLYYSGLGGRVVDDKRLFRLLTYFLLPRRDDLAHPIAGLSQSEFDLFYVNPSAFVVKEPNQSGGVGIFFPRAMAGEEVKALVARVRSAPQEFEIQYVATIATLPLESDSESGEVVKGEVPIDVRLFVMMDAEGNVRAGPNSLLIRTGARGGLYTNTSRGGGYGIGLVLSEQAVEKNRGSGTFDPNDGLVWGQQATAILPESRRENIRALHAQGREIAACLRRLDAESGLQQWSECQEKAATTAFGFRGVMDLMPARQLTVMDDLRHFAQDRDYADSERKRQQREKLADLLSEALDGLLRL